jgi:hypothetical protein
VQQRLALGTPEDCASLHETLQQGGFFASSLQWDD